ncbi:hypothetical protein P691DRAFT_766361 [Macrolepiota fuliginosa MF-IS2]|uniref:Uncharacterized protein n=1 Tax=Macrolepiota fuliginosa MF-IS2 TaxID=1400762 RepID=A0A9P5X0T2_9AGAR|nr:hypothetical protein P691DRAFT_766361 [Macrolepiota fuliginosa MF-IS2]
MAIGKQSHHDCSPTPTPNSDDNHIDSSPLLSQIWPWKKLWKQDTSNEVLDHPEVNLMEIDEDEDVEKSLSSCVILCPSKMSQACNEASNGLRSTSGSSCSMGLQHPAPSKGYLRKGHSSTSRGKGKGKAKGKGKGKAKVKIRSHQIQEHIKSLRDYLKVWEVIFLPDGIVENNTTVPSVPSSSKTILHSLPAEYILLDLKIKLLPDLVQHMVSHKLTVVRLEGIDFLKEAGFEDMQKQLQDLFPEIFALKDEYDDNINSEHAFFPHWMVCTKSNCQVNIASEATYPNGHILDLNANTT